MSIEKALRGRVAPPDVMAKVPPEGRLKAFAVEPEVMLNNSGFQPLQAGGRGHDLIVLGLLHELNVDDSSFNLNIASGMCDFASGVVDVFYVTVCSARRSTPSRQAGDQTRRCCRSSTKTSARPARRV